MQIEAALRAADSRLEAVLDLVGPPPLHRAAPVASRFSTLATAILHQQLAGPAAAAITRRATLALGGSLEASAVLAIPEPALRAAGVSQAKFAALKDLAGHVESGSLDLQRLARHSDEEVIEALSAVRGIGVWTAEMFLMHSLARRDVWPVGDLGVRQGWALICSEPVRTPAKLRTAAEHCRPWRSAVAWTCWQAVDLHRRGELSPR